MNEPPEMRSPAPSTFRHWARRMGLGRLGMSLFYRPTTKFRWLLGFGVRGAFGLVAGDAAMKRAARRLPPVSCPAGSPFEASYMTGRHHWHQTAFAAWSLAKVLPQGLKPSFFDDGTLTPAQVSHLRRIFPAARIVSREEIVRNLDRYLPRESFPLLRAAEQDSMFVRKLVGPRAGSGRWQLYLDSDMLFFRRPEALESAAGSKCGIYMVDHVFAYCMPPQEIEAITGQPLPPRVNGGLIGLDDAAIDWRLMESWMAKMPAAARAHSMLEQTLAAMLIGARPSVSADESTYRIMFVPGTPPGDAILLHYIYQSKLLFVTTEWRRLLALHGAA